MLIPKQTAEDYLQGIVILSEDNSIHIYPEHTKPILMTLAPNLFIHVVNADVCQVDGFSFGSSIEVSYGECKKNSRVSLVTILVFNIQGEDNSWCFFSYS